MSKEAKPRRLKGVEAMAKVRTLRTSPRKLNLVAQSIRGLKVQRALNELEFRPKRIARDVRKALYSAISNAENNHNLDIDNLVVAEAYVGKNLVMKRFSARARGRSSRIEKPFSDQPHAARHRRRRAVPGRAAGRGLGPAAQTGAEAGALRRRGRRVEHDVLRARRPHRAYRPAIDAGRAHPGEEQPVKGGITGEAGAVARFAIEFERRVQRHAPEISAQRGRC